MAELATVGVVLEDAGAVQRAHQLLEAYEDLYAALPNRDNVLGPSHLFFSTYLESVWMTSYLAAASILRDGGLLAEGRVEGVNRVADEAALVIGEFNEGMSNRQTWHAAALTAIAGWFQDEDLARSAVESPTGLLGHLTDGFGTDGLWWEGENYHLFAIRGLMQGLQWARVTGFELLDDPELQSHFRAALLAPSRSALPDCTFPARRDSRFGVSLAQPAYLELWEIGRAWLGGDPELGGWLGELYSRPAPPVEHYDAWLHDSGRPAPVRRTRSDLSWWALLEIGVAAETTVSWQPSSVLLGDQGVAVLRNGDRYVSLECGADTGGHSHPDRLHLTLHAGGVHWLPDLGTGSYVEPELLWYRSALAHNAPRVGGINAGGADAWCEAFATDEEWSWTRARAGEARRTIVAGPRYLLDIVEVDAPETREVDLPWHLLWEWRVESPGKWEGGKLEHPFVGDVERFVPASEGSVVVESKRTESGARLRIHFVLSGAELLRAVAPGIPTTGESLPFLLLRGGGRAIRWVTVVDWTVAGVVGSVSAVRSEAQAVVVDTVTGAEKYQFGPGSVAVEAGGAKRTLSGVRAGPPPRRALGGRGTDSDAHALVPRVIGAPALDGTLEGFDTSQPLFLDSEHQYRRSEEPFDPDVISAEAWLNWDEDDLYLAVEVHKSDVRFRTTDAPPLELDNEPEDLHSDGLQVYLHPYDSGEPVGGLVLVPQPGGKLHCRDIGTGEAEPLQATGSWALTEAGYLVTVRLRKGDITPTGGARFGFDLLVNEMRPDRLRRAGQLVWSGGNGWVYLRGDRHEVRSLGSIELG